MLFHNLLARMERGRGSEPANSRGLEGEWVTIGERLANVPESTELIFVDALVSRGNPLLRVLDRQASVNEFRQPSVREMPEWMRERADKLGAAIEGSAIAAIVDAIGNDTRLADVELQKLALYRTGGAIRRQDVEDMVSYVREANIFAAVDAALEGRAGQALRLIRQLLEAGRPPTYVITMIARQVRFLILAKDLKARGNGQAEIGRRLAISGYPLTKTMQQEGRFSAERLAEIHHSLLEADLSIKTGLADEETALDSLIIALSAGTGR